MRRNLLEINDLKTQEINFLLEEAEAFKEVLARPIKKLPTLRGKTILTLFYEPSTRTRMSFELAAKRMGADVSNIAVSASSIQKGENLKDTVRTLEAMGVDLIIIRHSQAGAPHLVAKTVKASVINAGDGTHEHPTQALLDLYTIKDKKKTFKGLKAAIVGDIAHSRVARSNIWAFTKMDMEVTLIAPPTLLPAEVEKLGLKPIKISYSLEEIIPKLDILYILRLQLERQKKGLFPSLQEYIKLYGVNPEKLRKSKRDLLIMHPGPMNIGVEITESVATSMQSAIEEQVHNGVAIRMALLNYLLGGKNEDPA
ncbi:MAG: aspartate carbamoyltransferase catalytic subunit [Armatimonadetes bacterium]|nr:aspartate carbamoyltransferase catalytic subunit [Armatimonadota bacterium]